MSTEETEEKKSGVLILLDLIILPFHTMWRGFVFLKLWGWFVLPLGGPHLTLLQAMGVQLILTYATFHGPLQREQLQWIQGWLVRWILPAVLLLIGWSYTLFM